MQPDELRAARKALALTQQQLGEALGMSRKAIVEMEADRSPIERRTAIAVEALLARVRLVSDTYRVERAETTGEYLVVRRTAREHKSDRAMYQGHWETWLYGAFNRRDHAYRWAAALQASDDPRNTRRLIRERQEEARQKS